MRDADDTGEPVLVLGGGSNLVVGDDGFPGTVVHLATRGVQVTPDGSGQVALTVAAGENWDALVERCVGDGLSGIECLSGIPGLAGATPIQNVGAYGQEVAGTLVTVRAYDRVLGTVVQLPAADCGFGYRTSVFKRRQAAAEARTALEPAAATGRWVVLGVTFRLMRDRLSAPVRYAELARALGTAEGSRVPLGEARSAVLALRRRKGMVLDPSDPDTRSAGSFFTNPVLDAEQFAELQRRVAARQPAGAGHPAHDAAVPHFPAEDSGPAAGRGLVKVPAAWLIEQAGFSRGYTAEAGARISSKHTLALVNPGDASTAALIGLARAIRDGVRQAFGIELVPEPVLVGTAL